MALGHKVSKVLNGDGRELNLPLGHMGRGLALLLHKHLHLSLHAARWVLSHQLVDSAVLGLSRGQGEGAILCQLPGVVSHHLLSIVVPRQLRLRAARHFHSENNFLSHNCVLILRELGYHWLYRRTAITYVYKVLVAVITNIIQEYGSTYRPSWSLHWLHFQWLLWILCTEQEQEEDWWALMLVCRRTSHCCLVAS